MRIHIQNPPGETTFPITPPAWAAAVARHGGGADHAVSFGTSDAELDAALAEAEALLTWTKVVQARFIAAPPPPAPRLKIISLTSAGLDRLLPMDWVPPGVAVLNNRGTHGAKAGEFAAMALLMLANNIPRHVASQARRTWAPLFPPVIAGRTVVVIGLGTLGGAAAAQAAQLGMRVIGVTASGRPHPSCTRVVPVSELDQVLPEAAFLLIACPLTPATRNLLDRRRIGKLPAGAGVVNIGRGAVWDQDAVLDALEAGHLSGAVVDVWVPEPLPPEHRAWTTPHVIVVPHCSSDDPTTYNDLTLDIFLRNLAEHVAGRPMPNRVDPARGY
jgi:phosphoglycerate dehydrogenase-like enzyme